jgi:hypothetical protein
MRQVQKTMFTTATLWMRTLKVPLKAVKDAGPLPTQIYLCGGGALLPVIKSAFNGVSHGKDTSLSQLYQR